MKRFVLKTGILILLGVMFNYFCSMRIPIPAMTTGRLQRLLDGCVTAFVIWIMLKAAVRVYDWFYCIKLRLDERYVLSGERLKELEISTAEGYIKYLWSMLYERPVFIHLPFIHLEINIRRKHTGFGKKQYHEVGFKLFYRFFDEMAEIGMPVYDWGKVNKGLCSCTFMEYAVAAQCVKQEHPGLPLDMVAVYPMAQAVKLFPEYAPDDALQSALQSFGDDSIEDIRLMVIAGHADGQPADVYYIEDDSYWKKV